MITKIASFKERSFVWFSENGFICLHFNPLLLKRTLRLKCFSSVNTIHFFRLISPIYRTPNLPNCWLTKQHYSYGVEGGGERNGKMM